MAGAAILSLDNPVIFHLLSPRIVRSGVCLLALGVLLAGCGRGGRGKTREVAYIAAPQVALRDRVAVVYNKTGVARNGERVEVLERARRFVRVRTASGVEGWVEQRFLVGKDVFDGLQKLTQENRDAPGQAHGTTRAETNLHITPGREAEHLYQLLQGEKVTILRRAVTERVLPGTPANSAAKPKIEGKEPPKPVLEDWWLVRDAQNRVGWVLSRLVDLDIPLEVAQYAEGQRVVAFFVLNEVNDAGKKVSQYLVLFSEPKDGLPFDYDQIRVFTWNLKRHRYETAYRERKLAGMLPVRAGRETFEKEGDLPFFALQVQDASGQPVERKYKMNGVMVRRVLAPGEQPAKRRRR